MKYRDRPNTYGPLNDYLGRRNEREYGYETTVRRDRDEIVVRYFATDIVRYRPDGTMSVRSGGYRTVTTQKRINHALRPYGWTVYQSDWQWYYQRIGYSRNAEVDPIFYGGETFDLADAEGPLS